MSHTPPVSVPPQPQPRESSPPRCPSPPLLPVCMNVYFLFPWCLSPLLFNSLSVLVVRGGAVCLPTPSSWFSPNLYFLIPSPDSSNSPFFSGNCHPPSEQTSIKIVEIIIQCLFSIRTCFPPTRKCNGATYTLLLKCPSLLGRVIFVKPVMPKYLSPEYT